MSQQQPVLLNALPVKTYLDPACLHEEREKIFTRCWQYACHIEKLRKTGDFIVCDIAGESIILIRSEDDAINALYNVCAHRAARLLEGEGCKKRFSCPYHAWTYNPHGELISAPNAVNVAGFDVANYRLKSCRVEVIHGLVFVNLDPDAEPLQAQIPEFSADLMKYAPNLPDLTFVHRTEAMLQANWKVAIENYAECYHCELIHKELVNGVLDFDSYSIEVIGQGQKHLSRPRSGSAKAYDFDETFDSEFVAWWQWPNFSFQNYPGGRVQLWNWVALGVDRTHLTVDWYFPSKDMAEWERKLIEHHASTTFVEDLAIMNSVQEGLGSRGYELGPLMIDAEKSRYSEHAIAAIQQLWRDAIEDPYEQ